jgi:osmotically-inducible protein OsmY
MLSHATNKECVMTDSSLKSDIMLALADNPVVHSDEISVQVVDGDVVLRGTVGSAVQQTEAARTTRGVPGVRNVDNELRLRLMGIDRWADADTEAAVLDALIVSDEFDMTDASVESRHGTVTLRGHVQEESERDRAERIALAVPGVSHVDNRLGLRPAMSSDASDVIDD